MEDDSYQLIVFIKRDTDGASTRLLKEKIEGLDYVTKVEWITKKQVLQSLFEEYGDYADIIDMFAADNPLMDELRITISGGEDAVNSVLEWLDDRGDDGGIKDCIEKYDGPRRKEKTA